MSGAEYYALLSRAYQGAVTREEMMWEISLTEAHAMLLASGILQGGSYVWPDPRLSTAGRQMLRVREKLERWRKQGIGELIDL